MYVERWKYVERAAQTPEPQEQEQDFKSTHVTLKRHIYTDLHMSQNQDSASC